MLKEVAFKHELRLTLRVPYHWYLQTMRQYCSTRSCTLNNSPKSYTVRFGTVADCRFLILEVNNFRAAVAFACF